VSALRLRHLCVLLGNGLESDMRPRTRIKSPRIGAERLEMAARALRVLAHPSRLRIVEILMEGPIPVGELAEEIGLGQAAVSQHLNHMRAHGIVESERDGRQVFYEVVDPNALHVIQCIREHADGG